MSKKKMDKTTKNSMQEILGYYQSLNAGKKELEAEIEKDNENVQEFFSEIIPWAALFSFPQSVLLRAFFERIGWLDRLIAASKADDSVEESLKLCRELFAEKLDFKTQFLFDSMEGQERSIFLAIFFAMLGNIEGLQKYQETVSDLVAKSQNDRESLLKAVAVDRSVIAHPIIAKEISLAHVMHDESFMQKLAKSITQTKPRRNKVLDNFRYMVEIFDEVAGIRSVTYEVLADFLVNDLRVYPESVRGDAGAAIKKAIQVRNLRIGK